MRSNRHIINEEVTFLDNEGITSQKQMDYLNEGSWDYYQVFLLSKSISIAQRGDKTKSTRQSKPLLHDALTQLMVNLTWILQKGPSACLQISDNSLTGAR